MVEGSQFWGWLAQLANNIDIATAKPNRRHLTKRTNSVTLFICPSPTAFPSYVYRNEKGRAQSGRYLTPLIGRLALVDEGINAFATILSNTHGGYRTRLQLHLRFQRIVQAIKQ